MTASWQDFSDDGREPAFKDWLWERHQTTPLTVKLLCRETAMRGFKREYEGAMEWYRRRYRMEMETRRALIAANPFTKSDNGGLKNE